MSFGELNLVGVTVQENSSYCGVGLSCIQLPKNCVAVGLVRKEQLILAGDKPTVQYGDYILALALNPALVPALKMTLRKTHPISWSPLRCSLNWEENYLLLTKDFVDIYV
ncbi:TrkA C-terminal domain-containing protein [Chroococcidiopsis sp.]|uniref:TrkA C-terminal domain-containing protein n=1 Tax=Chroococcidiopsis sp. TaxID=3088168 RepID=UPI003F2EC635